MENNEGNSLLDKLFPDCFIQFFLKWQENFVFFSGPTIFIAMMISISVDRYIVNACIVKNNAYPL